MKKNLFEIAFLKYVSSVSKNAIFWTHPLSPFADIICGWFLRLYTECPKTLYQLEKYQRNLITKVSHFISSLEFGEFHTIFWSILKAFKISYSINSSPRLTVWPWSKRYFAPFKVFCVYRHSSIPAVSISAIFELSWFIILSYFPPL